MVTPDWVHLRHEMVADQLKFRGIKDHSILAAFEHVPRHEFVPPDFRSESYKDHPVPIGEDQTISQPYIVALMTSLIEPKRNNRILEIGTGSGYQTAILAELVSEVFSVEIRPKLLENAENTLNRLGFTHIHFKMTDGYFGWPEEAPFDKILIAACCEKIPPPLLAQLKDPGIMVYPCGSETQNLICLKKHRGKTVESVITAVRFVELVHNVGRN